MGVSMTKNATKRERSDSKENLNSSEIPLIQNRNRSLRNRESNKPNILDDWSRVGIEQHVNVNWEIPQSIKDKIGDFLTIEKNKTDSDYFKIFDVEETEMLIKEFFDFKKSLKEMINTVEKFLRCARITLYSKKNKTEKHCQTHRNSATNEPNKSYQDFANTIKPYNRAKNNAISKGSILMKFTTEVISRKAPNEVIPRKATSFLRSSTIVEPNNGSIADDEELQERLVDNTQNGETVALKPKNIKGDQSRKSVFKSNRNPIGVGKKELQHSLKNLDNLMATQKPIDKQVKHRGQIIERMETPIDFDENLDSYDVESPWIFQSKKRANGPNPNLNFSDGEICQGNIKPPKKRLGSYDQSEKISELKSSSPYYKNDNDCGPMTTRQKKRSSIIKDSSPPQHYTYGKNDSLNFQDSHINSGINTGRASQNITDSAFVRKFVNKQKDSDKLLNENFLKVVDSNSRGYINGKPINQLGNQEKQYRDILQTKLRRFSCVSHNQSLNQIGQNAENSEVRKNNKRPSMVSQHYHKVNFDSFIVDKNNEKKVYRQSGCNNRDRAESLN